MIDATPDTALVIGAAVHRLRRTNRIPNEQDPEEPGR